MTAVQREVQQSRDHENKAGNYRKRFDSDSRWHKHGEFGCRHPQDSGRDQVGLLLNYLE
jgi:hypothetical protein